MSGDERTTEGDVDEDHDELHDDKDPVGSLEAPGWSFKGSWTGKSEYILQALILVCIIVLAFSLRLFAVIRYESVIHEFDPWFHFRTTKFLAKEGMFGFHNWFDNMSWYPLGRWIGGTVYPGLAWSAYLVYYVCNFVLNITISVRDTCVFLAPMFAGMTALVAYLIGNEVWSSHAGIFSAFFMSIVPGYVSRSVAGSYDNEAVAIFAMLLTFYLWLKAVRTGSMMWGGLTSLGYFYMVSAWGGYIFITNIIPVHVSFLIFSGRYSDRLYVAYTTYFVLGSLMSMQVLFVSFQPISSPEHISAIGVFIVLQVIKVVQFIRNLLPGAKQQKLLWRIFTFAAVVVGVLGAIVASQANFVKARLKALLGSTSVVAIVKSVSEHQPTSWGTYWFDLNVLTFMAAAGLALCFSKLSELNSFVILYGVFAAYFSNIMIRLILVFAPAACLLSGIATSELVSSSFEVLARPMECNSEPPIPEDEEEDDARGESEIRRRADERPDTVGLLHKATAFTTILIFVIIMFQYCTHCTYITSNAYSSPSIVLGSSSSRVFDDFREAYQWLNHNTSPTAKIGSWWDYGYQITGMGNRTIIVDNNTRNNTHIAGMGLILSSTEEKAYPIMRRLDVNYMLVVFGGLIGYSSDDINKFLWMVRIASGVFPRIQENNYYRGGYKVDKDASPTMKNCMMYKMSYFRYHTTGGQYGYQGYDRTRNARVPKTLKLKYLEEAYTTEHWMVRIYRVKEPDEISRYVYAP